MRNAIRLIALTIITALANSARLTGARKDGRAPARKTEDNMRKATLSLALFFAAVSSQAAIVYKNFSQPVSFTYFVPCANAGQGELITFSGTMQTTLAEALENGWIIAQFHIQPLITGLGQTTGITYQVVGSQTFTAKLSPAKVATGIDANNFGIVGDGGNYHLHENFNYVFSNGDFQSFGHDNFFVFCQ